jgi:hypothetical protein
VRESKEKGRIITTPWQEQLMDQENNNHNAEQGMYLLLAGSHPSGTGVHH